MNLEELDEFADKYDLDYLIDQDEDGESTILFVGEYCSFNITTTIELDKIELSQEAIEKVFTYMNFVIQ